MSASREKNKRKELAQNPVEKTAATPAKKEMSKGLKTTLGVVIAVVVIAVVVFFYMLTSGFFATHTTAVTVGEHKLSPAMTNFYYVDAYNYTMNQWGDMASYILDPEAPLSEQIRNEETGETWADYFLDTGLTSAAQMYALYDDAQANGFALTQEQQEQVDTQLETMELYAGMYGYTNLDSFIAANYGEGCDAKTYKEYLLVNTTAEAYSTFVGESFTYTADDIAAEYAANADNYDGVDYRIFTISASNYEVHDHEEGEEVEHTEEETAAIEAAAMEAARADAEAMTAAIEGADEATFHAQCIEYAPEASKASYEADEDYSLRLDTRKSNFGEEQAAWLFDASRVAGDTTCIENDSSFTLLYFVGRNDHAVNMPSVRHILFAPTDASVETEVIAAQEKAEAALAAYEAGEHTEEAFETLSATYQNDGSAAEVALYEDIYPGQMVAEFEAWCYDADRKTGDTGIVQSQYSYHVMYYVGTGDTLARDYLVENALRTADFTAWQEGIVGEASYEIVNDKLINK